MVYQNKISTTIAKKDLEAVLDAIAFIDKKLDKLVCISKEERASLYHCGEDEETLAFVMNAVSYARKHPEVVPEDVPLEEMIRDAKLINAIDKIKEPLEALLKKLNDSASLAGSEAYIPAMAIFNYAKLSDTLNLN